MGEQLRLEPTLDAVGKDSFARQFWVEDLRGFLLLFFGLAAAVRDDTAALQDDEAVGKTNDAVESEEACETNSACRRWKTRCCMLLLLRLAEK